MSELRICLLALLVGICTLVFCDPFRRGDHPRTTAARAQIASFQHALERYRGDVGEYPSEQEGLAALWSSSGNRSNWKGPYLRKEVPVDPWGNPYVYRISHIELVPEIISYGADGKPGGTGLDADIVSPIK
jgi:general secretion pathway protein G